MTAGSAVSIITDTQGHTINNTQTFAAGTGLSLVKTGDAYQYTNAHPMVIINADGACYMPGTLSELIFANTQASLADGKLTLTPQASGGTTVSLTAGPGISVNGLEISNAHLFSAGTGVSVAKTNDTHVFNNTLPICAFTVSSNTYAAGTVDEIIFGAGATSSISGSQLTIGGFGASGDTVTAGNGIGVSLSNGVKTITNTKPAHTILVDSIQHNVSNLAFNNFTTTVSGTTLVIESTGLQGEKGDPGVQGVQGLQGLLGPEGPAGPQGPQGLVGQQGAQGAQGDTGAQGPQGLPGQQGTQGSQGDTGAQGPQGLPGQQGAQGAQGDTGAQGPQGLPGQQGAQGAQGDTGAQGLQGVQGPQGLPGNTGPQGIQGDKGDQGDPGTSLAIALDSAASTTPSTLHFVSFSVNESFGTVTVTTSNLLYYAGTNIAINGANEISCTLQPLAVSLDGTSYTPSRV